MESDIRPNAVTNAIAKIAEKFVSEYSNDYYDDCTDVNQFGSVRGRLTIHALLRIIHEVFSASDCSKNITRILFVDYDKTFYQIVHNVPLNKFVSSHLPEHIVVWSLNFLRYRKQFVKIGDYLYI